MDDRFVPLPLTELFRMVIENLEAGHYFGIPREVFYLPLNDKLHMHRFGRILGTPVGPAAGPHTQLAQNIAGAWLCGARYIELKTIQTLDELEISKPCIDMQDEGYNCEWSQELKIQESYEQYLDAWILIHLLAEHLKWEDATVMTIFNMSVGYNMEGILAPNVQWFFDKMNDCSLELEEKINTLAHSYPWVKKVNIPTRISDNITLSTMHGCPPDEIEKIGMYLIHEKRLHTIIKLNPTLLGPQKVRGILNESLGYKTPVPDAAFEHDLKYTDAKRFITNLRAAALEQELFFGLKLTNTLESNNFRKAFSPDQAQMYMSGRALHPLAVNLAAMIRKDFPEMDISFSAGADCFNIRELLACNLGPVTVCTDLLKPGGYGRLSQYLCHLEEELYHRGIKNIEGLMIEDPEGYLEKYSDEVIHQPEYRKALREPNIKTLRHLGFFDCIHAPCQGTCPGEQDIPLYMHYATHENWQKAFEVVMQTNPFPSITGTVCNHECQSKCTRINYDSSLAIREIKRYIAEFEHDESFLKSLTPNGLKAVVIGAGPAGLSCAWFLRLAGFEVDVYEGKAAAGGMVQQVIPEFRIKLADIESDISRIERSGINFHYNTRITAEIFEQFRASGSFIFIGTGAGNAGKLNIPGDNHPDVKDPLEFLSRCKSDPHFTLSEKNILIIGGGNTAIDVARTARRLADEEATVSIVYRRALEDMPAMVEEIMDAMNEGIEIYELLSPQQIISSNEGILGLQCIQMEIAGTDERGRRMIKPLPGQLTTLDADLIIPCVGQHTQWDFIPGGIKSVNDNSYTTNLERVYLGGDARAGAASIISAIADGRKAAQEIIEHAGKEVPGLLHRKKEKAPVRELLIRKANRIRSNILKPFSQQKRIDSYASARAEAERCLLCDEICNICVTVCPNFANQGFTIQPVKFILQTVEQDEEGKVIFTEEKEFSINQKYQVYNIADFCNECGNCRTFCPTSGAPYRDKIHIHLSEKSWNESNEGFRILSNNGMRKIIYKDGNNNLYSLSTDAGSKTLTYHTPVITAKLDTANLKVMDIEFHQPGKADMNIAATMYVILEGLKENHSLYPATL